MCLASRVFCQLMVYEYSDCTSWQHLATLDCWDRNSLVPSPLEKRVPGTLEGIFAKVLQMNLPCCYQQNHFFSRHLFDAVRKIWFAHSSDGHFGSIWWHINQVTQEIGWPQKIHQQGHDSLEDSLWSSLLWPNLQPLPHKLRSDETDWLTAMSLMLILAVPWRSGEFQHVMRPGSTLR